MTTESVSDLLEAVETCLDELRDIYSDMESGKLHRAAEAETEARFLVTTLQQLQQTIEAGEE